MYTLKMDRNEYTKDGRHIEIWGYTLTKDGKTLQSDIIKGRVKDDDSRMMKYIRCYQWALQKVQGYFQTTDVVDDLTVCFTSTIIDLWLHKTPEAKYRISFDDMMAIVDNIPMTIRFLNVDKSWGFRKTLIEENIKRERYTSVKSFLSSVGE